ncbi:MAG: hypothetical protein LBF91_02600, partial [Azoarcus sp.]|nr:hypothetical protein [Azoarcus sp.]
SGKAKSKPGNPKSASGNAKKENENKASAKPDARQGSVVLQRPILAPDFARKLAESRQPPPAWPFAQFISLPHNCPTLKPGHISHTHTPLKELAYSFKRLGQAFVMRCCLGAGGKGGAGGGSPVHRRKADGAAAEFPHGVE